MLYHNSPLKAAVDEFSKWYISEINVSTIYTKKHITSPASNA